jgi:phospholipid transport system substrate-binding protein
LRLLLAAGLLGAALGTSARADEPAAVEPSGAEAGSPGAAAAGEAAQTASIEAALDVVQRLHAALIAAAKLDGADGLERRYALLEPVVEATHDLPYIAELAIRRQWRDLNEAQREAYVRAFVHLSVMTYAARFAGVGDDTFRIIGAESVDGGRIRVQAAIARRDADDVSMDYLLQRDGQDWRIVNILADRVSDLALKRAEYQRILGTGSIDDLIEHIESEAASL